MASKTMLIITGLIGLVLLWLLAPITVIPSGHRGVVTTFGKIHPEPLDEGLHLRWPIINSVHKVPVQIQKEETEGDAASKDLQQVTTKIALNYHLLPARVPQTYQEVGMDWASRIIDPAVSEVFKSITASYTAEELITKREEVTTRIRAGLDRRLSLNGIKVDQVSIVNFRFSRSFNEAIEAKVTAEQNKLKAERDLMRIKVEAEQKITQADAEAKALRAQRQEVTVELLRLREIENQRLAIEKWDGKLPATMAGGAVPFVQIGGK